MFIGHYAMGFAAKRVAPKLSLGLFFLATQFVDMLWPLFLLFGLEHVRIAPGNTAFTPLDFYDYPYSHSLLFSLIWSVALGAAVRLAGRRTSESIVTGGLVFSHWLLDMLTHRPDLPLAPGSAMMFGMGLWNSVLWTSVVEWLLFAGGIYIYARGTTPLDKQGRYGLWLLVGVLAAISLANTLGPPPPDTAAIAYAGLGLWLFVLMAFWVDRHRTQAER